MEAVAGLAGSISARECEFTRLEAEVRRSMRSWEVRELRNREQVPKDNKDDAREQACKERRTGTHRYCFRPLCSF